jgi:hypothetical protein
VPSGRKSEATRDRAALLLASGRTIKRAAEKAGISRRCLTEWLTEEAFRARVREFRERLIRETVGRLAQAGAGAVRTLVKLTGDGVKPEVKRSAAATLLANLLRGAELVDMAQDLSEIKRRLDAAGGGGTDAGDAGDG